MPNEIDRSEGEGADQFQPDEPRSEQGSEQGSEGGARRDEGRQGEDQPRKKQRRGFAAMDPAKQREIASKGGKASHEQGTGHEWNSETAREAGRKGGQASHGGRGKRAVTTPTAGGGGESPPMAGGEGGEG